MPSDFTGRVPARVALLNGWFELRKLVNMTHYQMLKRCTLHTVNDLPMLRLDIRDWCYHDGRMLPECHHGGIAGPCWHGTKYLQQVLTSRVVMKSSARDRCLHKNGKCFYGWYHSPHFATAYQYAEKKTILGDHIYSAVFQFESCCMNSCNRSNRWYYTKHECLRYRVVALVLVCNREYKPRVSRTIAKNHQRRSRGAPTNPPRPRFPNNISRVA